VPWRSSGNWLTATQARALWQVPDPGTLKGKRDRALLGILLGCGLRRREAAELEFAHIQRREDHWAIVDLVGKGRHIRTVPVPDWVKTAIDSWCEAAGVSGGRVFRCVCRADKTWGTGVTERSCGTSSKTAPNEPESTNWLPTIFDARAHGCVVKLAAS
jgi:integrase